MNRRERRRRGIGLSDKALAEQESMPVRQSIDANPEFACGASFDRGLQRFVHFLSVECFLGRECELDSSQR